MRCCCCARAAQEDRGKAVLRVGGIKCTEAGVRWWQLQRQAADALFARWR
jgi:hypothetical protein